MRVIAIKKQYENADYFDVILYGSLAKTGKGHGTDCVIKKTLAPKKCNIIFNTERIDIPHPNTFDVIIYQDGKEYDRKRIFSVGGGSIVIDGDFREAPKEIYTERRFEDIVRICKDRDIRLWQYVLENEDDRFYSYMGNVWESMKESIKNGLSDDGILPGGLEIQKKQDCYIMRNILMNQWRSVRPEWYARMPLR